MITRDIINKNILFKDIPSQETDVPYYSYAELSESIDICKNVLENKYGAKAGQTALIGANPGKIQIALIFACAELGITLVIVDYDRSDHWAIEDYIDPKTRALMPIDYFLFDDHNNSRGKYKLFNKICNKVIILSDELQDKTPNLTINVNRSSIFIKCTSSGTTGTPKIIEHTHGFIYELVKRNKVFFDGAVGVLYNLNHGSSIATFFLPALLSENVTTCYSILWSRLNTKINKKINHLMIPYPHLIDLFLKNNTSTENLIIYTLSTIKREWLSYLKQNLIKDIISIFGSNETSGPVLINKASDLHFYESKYKTIDDFYTINLSENDEFLVTLPIYNKTINTNDKFKFNGNNYYHLGRNDLIRVNGVHVNLLEYQKMAKKILNCDLIFDSLQNNIYLAVWNIDGDINNKVNTIDKNLRNYSNNAHYISNYDILDFDKFISGIKLDQELLRDYFRNYVEKKY